MKRLTHSSFAGTPNSEPAEDTNLPEQDVSLDFYIDQDGRNTVTGMPINDLLWQTDHPGLDRVGNPSREIIDSDGFDLRQTPFVSDNLASIPEVAEAESSLFLQDCQGLD